MFIWIILIIIAVFGAIYLFLVSPRLVRKADMELLKCNYAHRGLWSEDIPENSLAAFARAVEAGVGIELDIQLSKDNKIVVFHDSNLKRMCGVDKKISDLTYDELKQISLGNSLQTIPAFADVLKLVDGRVPLLIELKGTDLNTDLCKRAAAMLDKYHGAFCVESFNPYMLRWFKKFRPRYARGQLVTKVTKNDRKGSVILNFGLSHMLFNSFSRPDFIAVDFKVRKSFMIFVCEKFFGASIFAWTIRKQDEYDTCRDEGLYSIFEKILP